MLEAIYHKTAHILLVTKNEELKKNAETVLRQQGYTTFFYASTPLDAKRMVSENLIHWIIGELFSEMTYNSLSLLQDLLKNPDLHDVRTSLFLSEKERSAVPLLFEYGLLSVHPENFSEAALNKQLGDLYTTIQRFQLNPVKTAAHFLRTLLIGDKKYQSLAHLEENLIEKFPGEPELLLNYAFAQLQMGKFDAASSLISQAQFLDKRLEAECQQLQTKIAKQRMLAYGSKVADKSKRFGVKNAVIIDSDESITYYVENLLKDLGIKEIQSFFDGEEAWKWLVKNPEPDLILMEWRLPQLSGMALVQRIRAHGFRSTAIVVLSSLVTKDDVPLLNEMSVANLIPKPFGKEEFYLPLRYTLMQEQHPTDQKVLEKKIMLALETRNWDEARSLKANFIADKKISDGRKALVEARFLYYENKIVEARDKVLEAIKLSGHEPLDSVNLLGKCFLKLGEEKSAIKCFERAQAISPQNIQRLCEIADISANTGDMTRANLALKKAKKLDKKNNDVVKTSTKIAIQSNDLETARNLMQEANSQKELIAFMNNHAIAMTMSGRVEDGSDLYKKTLETIPDKSKDLKAIVAYNLALSYVRQDKIHLANLALQDAVDFAQDDLLVRAESLKRRLEKAIISGKKPLLNLQTKDNLDDIDFDLRAAAPTPVAIPQQQSTSVKPGDFCLYLIFRHQETLDKFSKALLSKENKAADEPSLNFEDIIKSAIA